MPATSFMSRLRAQRLLSPSGRRSKRRRNPHLTTSPQSTFIIPSPLPDFPNLCCPYPSHTDPCSISVNDHRSRHPQQEVPLSASSTHPSVLNQQPPLNRAPTYISPPPTGS